MLYPLKLFVDLYKYFFVPNYKCSLFFFFYSVPGVFPLKPDEVDLSEPSAIEKQWKQKEEKDKKTRGEPKKEAKTLAFRKYSDMVFTDLDTPKPRPVQTVQNHIQVPIPGGGFMLYPTATPVIQPAGASVINVGSLAGQSALVGQRPALVNLSNVQTLSKAVSPGIAGVNTTAVSTGLVSTTPVSSSAARTSESVDSSLTTSPSESAEMTQEKRDKLSKAFGKDMVNTVLNVQKLNGEAQRKSMKRKVATTSGETVTSGDVTEDVSSPSGTETDEQSVVIPDSSAAPEEGANESGVESTDESVETPMEVEEGTQEEQTPSTDEMPAIPLKISKVWSAADATIDAPSADTEEGASTVGSQELAADPATRKSPRKASTSAPDTDVDAPVADTSEAGEPAVLEEPATESAVRKSPRKSTRTTSESSATVDVESNKAPGARDDAPAASTNSPVALSPKKSTDESSKKKSTRSASKTTPSKDSTAKTATSGAKTSAGKKTSRRATAKSMLSSTGALGTTDEEDDEEEFDDLASFDSEIDDDDELQTTKEKPSPKKPPPTLKPNVTVPSSVLDRIQAMISGNESLLTSLEEKEAASKVKPPKEPTPKPPVVQTQESVETKLSKAFNADVLSTVMAVKQDLAKRPPLLFQDPPVQTFNPVQVLPVGTSPIMYSLPKTGGPIVLPTGTLFPVQQAPIIIQPAVPAPAKEAAGETEKDKGKAKKDKGKADPKITMITTKNKGKKNQSSVAEKRTSRRKTNTDASEEASVEQGKKNNNRRKTANKQTVENEGRAKKGKDSDPDFLVKISNVDQPEVTPVRKSSRKPMPKVVSDAEEDDNTSASPPDQISGSRKRKASLIKRQNEGAAGSAKKLNVDIGSILTGRTTRAKSKETPKSKRTKSLKK